MTETAFKFRIVFATTSRSEYFQMRPLIFKMMEAPDFEPSVLVGGAHLSDDHGRTLAAIEADDVPIASTDMVVRGYVLSTGDMSFPQPSVTRRYFQPSGTPDGK